MPNFRAEHVQCHASVSQQTMLLDGVDVGPPKWCVCGYGLNHSVHESTDDSKIYENCCTQKI